MDYWELTPAETEAISEAWRHKEKTEAKRFAVLLSCITGQQIEAPEDEADKEDAMKAAAKVLESSRNSDG